MTKAFDNYFNEALSRWEHKVEDIRTSFGVRVAVVGLGTIIFVLTLAYIYHQHKKSKKMMEAFFKFEPTDLEAKIKVIHETV